MRWLTLAVLLCSTGPAIAQPADSVVATGSLLMGCRALVENAPTGNTMRVCPPGGSGVLDAAHPVIRFVDERPERKTDQFGPRILMALGDRWPC
jgi:hypothetical protein